MSRPRILGSLLGLVLVATPTAFAQALDRPKPTCIRNVSLDRTGESEERFTLVLREGRIEAVLPADAPAPKGVHLVDGEGLLCLPAFVDAYTRTGVALPEPKIDQDVPVDTASDVRVDMRAANRKGIRPAFRAAQALAIDRAASEAWREAGFGLALVSPVGELLSGTSCLVTTREAAMRDLVVTPDVFACAGFRAGGPGYPSTLMGYHAQLRQFFLDAQRQTELQRRSEAGRSGPRPPFDAELTAGSDLLGGGRTVLCEAESHRDVERWIKLADAFGFRIAVSGGRDAWRVADVLAEREIPVLLTLDWGKEVEDPNAKDEKKEEGEAPEAIEEIAAAEEGVSEAAPVEAAAEEDEEEPEIAWEYEEPLGVRLERRREWEETRACAIRLYEKGVSFAFGTDGDKPAKLLERVRALVEAGLPADAALAALTTDAAELLGVEKRVGRIAPGYDATLALWSADPLTEKKAKPVFVFVDGRETKYDRPEEGAETEGGAPDEGVDASGRWILTVQGDGDEREVGLELEMAEDGSVTGTLTQENPMDQSKMEIDVTGAVNGKELTLEGTFSFGDTEVDFRYGLTLDGDELSGEATINVPMMPQPIVRSVEGKRTPDRR